MKPTGYHAACGTVASGPIRNNITTTYTPAIIIIIIIIINQFMIIVVVIVMIIVVVLLLFLLLLLLIIIPDAVTMTMSITILLRYTPPPHRPPCKGHHDRRLYFRLVVSTAITTILNHRTMTLFLRTFDLIRGQPYGAVVLVPEVAELGEGNLMREVKGHWRAISMVEATAALPPAAAAAAAAATCAEVDLLTLKGGTSARASRMRSAASWRFDPESSQKG